MKKMNNKGFAISSLLYGLLLVTFLIVTMLISTMASNRKNTTYLVDKIDDELSRLGNSHSEFGYTGDVQEFIVPYGMAGWYKIELWGASGSDNINETDDARGIYTSGTIYLDENEHLYFYVGGKGTNNSSKPAYNRINSDNKKGGGATDVRLVSGGKSYNDTESLKNSIMVAPGGNDGGKSKTSLSVSYYISGYDGNNPLLNYDGKTYKFQVGKIINKITSEDGKASISFVSPNPKDQPPMPSNFLSSNETSNFYLSFLDDKELILTSEPDGVKLKNFAGDRNQKWTIKDVTPAGVSQKRYALIENEDFYALQPAETDGDGNSEAGSPLVSSGIYSGNIWEQWIIEEKAGDTGNYYIKYAGNQNLCLSVENAAATAKAGDLIKLKKCSDEMTNTFQIDNADY